MPEEDFLIMSFKYADPKVIIQVSHYDSSNTYSTCLPLVASENMFSFSKFGVTRKYLKRENAV